ncbi:polyprenyl synthetase family protein [Demequina sediminicola]|uniref:polyprenyl synthetase family protein n=1 Tax=Demequina sediminicola TaxID=1095026 RepID=UPI0013792F10|nr:polyprenyl synthetase family protein [Demequina sediminicola]
MTDLAALWKNATDDAIFRGLDAVEASVASVGDASKEIIAPLRDAASGGKRLRALLMLASHRAHTGSNEAAVTSLAAGLELFQTAALLHDDVLDGSDTRRGMPATHRRIETFHGDQRWEGSGEDYGKAGGILAGDVALMASHRLVSDAHHSAADTGYALSQMFAQMAELVTLGQYADMRAAVQPLASLGDQRDEILTVMRCKTASYSSEYPLAMGAVAAGASKERVAQLHKAGVSLGLAFQLRDDVLGLVGSPELTGKPSGDDIREGKRTLLIWDAWTHGDSGTRAAIEQCLGDRAATQEQVSDAVSAVMDTGALDRAEQEISALYSSANSELFAVDLEPEGARVLSTIAHAAVHRLH